MLLFFFFFNDTATTEIYTLSLHDALPICCEFGVRHGPGSAVHRHQAAFGRRLRRRKAAAMALHRVRDTARSEEHTSELQSHSDLVCRLLLEKKKTNN